MRMREQRLSSQNRRVRGRTHGGVGGGVSNGSPYLMLRYCGYHGILCISHNPTHQEVKEAPRTINCTVVLPRNVFMTGEPIIVA